jgi:hypothetical protein
MPTYTAEQQAVLDAFSDAAVQYAREAFDDGLADEALGDFITDTADDWVNTGVANDHQQLILEHFGTPDRCKRIEPHTIFGGSDATDVLSRGMWHHFDSLMRSACTSVFEAMIKEHYATMDSN